MASDVLPALSVPTPTPATSAARDARAMLGHQVAQRSSADRFASTARTFGLVEGRARTWPWSACTRNSVEIGTSPRNGTPSSAARRFAPPEPKMSCRALQSGQRKKLMFSTMPSTVNVHLAEHGDGLHGVQQGNVLRRADDHGPGKRQQLGKRQRHVARAGRHVDHQIVQVAPGRVAEKLRQRRVQHRARARSPPRPRAPRNPSTSPATHRRPPAGCGRRRCRAADGCPTGAGCSGHRRRHPSDQPRNRPGAAHRRDTRRWSSCRRLPCPIPPPPPSWPPVQSSPSFSGLRR